ncbi:MAG: serine hydrolase [Ignavibacteriales bacterium]|nr:serine hydrolase [Ignavibacteriales bacterium]
MKPILTKFLIAILYLSVYSNFSFSQENRIKLFDEYLVDYIRIKKVPSISAGLLEKDKVTWLGSFGNADLENNIPVTSSSLYRIASISKPITAVAILQLWERGLISLDTDARTYIPTFPVKKYKFTIRQLLNHTSGIRNYKEGEFDSKKFYATTEEALKLFAYDSLNFEPGTKYEYTSLGYTILAAIIEKVSKTSYENYLKKNVLLPAEMNSTLIDKQREIIQNRVRGYEKNAESNIVNAPLADLSVKVAGGGLLSTSKDLLMFAKAILENKLLKQSTFDMMVRKSRLKSGKEIDYGLGFSLTFENDSLKNISHNGAGTGFSSMLLINLKLKYASVHLINIRDRNLGLPAKDILEMLSSGVMIKPTKTLAEELMKTYLSFDIDSVNRKLIFIYKDEPQEYSLNEDEAIFFASDLIELNKTPDAIIYLKEVLKLYPKSFKVLVSIADSYLKDNNVGLALRYYRLASQIDNSNYRINSLVKRLSNK